MLDCLSVHAQVDSYVSDVVRLLVPKMTLDETLEKKDEFSEAVHVQLAKNMVVHDFQATSFIVTDLKPDVFVQVSMNEVNKERRLRR